MCPVIGHLAACLGTVSEPNGQGTLPFPGCSLYQDFGLSAQLSADHMQGLPCGSGSCQSRCPAQIFHQEVETMLQTLKPEMPRTPVCPLVLGGCEGW